MSENTSITDSLKKLWEQTSVAARVLIGMAMVAGIAAMIGVGWWASRPHYVPLANNLTPQQSAEIVSLLDAEGIASKRNFSGSGILVDQTKWNQANSIIGTVVEPTQIESNPMSSTMLMDPSSRDHRMTRDLEIRLGKTISQLANVESAHVHLGVPSREVFTRYQGEKTASVTVQLRAGASLNRKLSQSIVAMVANSVEGLSRQNVSLSDTRGNTYTFDDDSVSGVVAGQLEYQRHVEEDLAIKAESMLEKLLGKGKVVVRVSADIDFTKTQLTEKSYNPESKVTESEETTTTTGSADDPLAVGAAGTSPNLGGVTAGNGNRDVTLNNETRNVKFLNGEKTQIQTRQPGTIRRLTIAAMVNLVPGTDDGTAAADGTTTTTVDLEQIKSIIKTAVGFDATRQDEIEVLEVASLQETEVATEEAPAASPLDSLMPYILKGTLCFAAIVAMLIGWMTMRKTRPIELGAATERSINPQRARQLSELALLARNNPELFTSIVSAWTGQEGESTDETAAQTGSRAA